MMYADNREEALIERKEFESDFRHNPKAVKSVVGNWEWLVAPYKPVCLSSAVPYNWTMDLSFCRVQQWCHSASHPPLCPPI